MKYLKALLFIVGLSLILAAASVMYWRWLNAPSDVRELQESRQQQPLTIKYP